MPKKKETEVVKEKGKWFVKKGGEVLGRFGREDLAKEWLKSQGK